MLPILKLPVVYYRVLGKNWLYTPSKVKNAQTAEFMSSFWSVLIKKAQSYVLFSIYVDQLAPTSNNPSV